MSEKVLVCGSIAFDTIAVFEDHFSKHILPNNIHSLSISFLVPGLRKEYGGCAGNIKGIMALVKGMKAEEAIDRLEGIRCGFKPTSCPDQLAKALKEALA